MTDPTPDEPQELRPTPMADAIGADIEALGELRGASKRSMATLALRLARAIDELDENVPPTTLARLSQELRATMGSLTGEGPSEKVGLDRLLQLLSTPTQA